MTWSPAMQTKAEILVGSLFAGIAILIVWWANEPKSLDELDRAAARKDEKYRGWSMDRIETVKKLRAIARRGRMLTWQANPNGEKR